VKVVADDRERDAGVVECLRGMEGVQVCVERLRVGDYLVDNRLLFERKTTQDFAISLVDGRLFSQARRLVAMSYQPVCLLEGKEADASKGVSRESLQGALITLSVIMGIAVLRSSGPPESARLMCFAAQQLERFIRNTVHRPGYRPKGLRKRRLFVLQGLPGVGQERAVGLLDCLGSVEAVFRADVVTLSRVPGIGAKTAATIREIVEGEEGESYPSA
jgi:ERCC4-type nuclease